ncbi:MAG: hypothetical protein NTX53_03450 [candidate division WOR-3 bacterium]|nr:hypothetical protein [candidate division WOR-3 bacterium]
MIRILIMRMLVPGYEETEGPVQLQCGTGQAAARVPGQGRFDPADAGHGHGQSVLRSICADVFNVAAPVVP